MKNNQFISAPPIKSLFAYPQVFQDGEEVIITEWKDGLVVRLAMIHGKQRAGSHRKESYHPNDLYHSPFLIQQINAFIEVLGRIYSQVILFGLLLSDMEFYAFDLFIEGRYMDYPVFLDICKRNKIEAMPVIAKIAYSVPNVTAVMDEQNVKEVVIHPMRERTNPVYGRCILRGTA